MYLIQQLTRHRLYFINNDYLDFRVFIYKFCTILITHGINFPRQGIFKSECMTVPLILIAAIPVGSSTRTSGLSGFLLWYKDNLLIT